MRIDISSSSPTPIYRQLHDQIAAQIIRGELRRNEPLPPIRTLAKDLWISIITVRKAWELLEKDGLISTTVGRGSFVADLSSADIEGKRTGKLAERMRRDIGYYRQMGLTLEEYLGWITRLWD
jgi:GntR family transcriptional regulator